MKKMVIRVSGSPEWRRLLIVQEDGRFWTGRRWTRKRRHARLYADDQDVALVFRQLEEQQFKDKRLRTYEAPLNINVRADQDIDIQVLGGYLQRAVQILIDQDCCGTGPVPGSLVQLDVSWGDMQKV